MTTPLQIQVPLRWGDMDAQGHVNNAGLVDYLQEARVDFLLSGPNAHLLGGGIVVVQHQVSYRRPVVFSGEPVVVDVAPVEVGASRFRVGYEVRHDGELCAVARTTLCPFDFAAGRVRRLTDAERAGFADSVVPGLAELPALVAPRLRGRGHRTPVRVRWSDLDSYGHVNNVKFFDYVQEARILTTTQLDPGTARSGTADASAPGPSRGGTDGDRSLWLVARQDVDYVDQIAHRVDPYAVVTAPTRVGTTSIVLAAEIVDPRADDAVLARARTVLVRADASGHPVPLDDATRAVLRRVAVTE